MHREPSEESRKGGVENGEIGRHAARVELGDGAIYGDKGDMDEERHPGPEGEALDRGATGARGIRSDVPAVELVPAAALSGDRVRPRRRA